MLSLDLGKTAGQALTVLCLGAHSDDIEIGCGGTLLHLKSAVAQLKFHWVVFSATGPRAHEAAAAAELFTAGCAKEVVLKGFRDGFFPYSGGEVKDVFEELKGQVQPDVILTHWSGDAHQDHRLVSELTWNTFRNHLILEYEVPKYDGDMGRPNFFVPLDSAHYEKKVEYLFQSFGSQRDKHWFDRQTFLGLMRIRGMESNAPSGYAEAFFARKAVFQATGESEARRGSR